MLVLARVVGSRRIDDKRQDHAEFSHGPRHALGGAIDALTLARAWLPKGSDQLPKIDELRLLHKHEFGPNNFAGD